MTHLRTLVLLVLSLCPTSWMLAQASQNLSSDSSVIHKKLPNGFSYFLYRDTAFKNQKIALRLAVKAGSLNETDEQRGYAHFVEHMGFNGTQHFSQAQLMQFFAKAGMHFGADANASTGFDYTAYRLDVPQDSIAHLKEALQIMADWAQGMSFLPHEVDREKGVILAERQMYNNPQSRFTHSVMRWFFQAHPLLAQRFPIGDSTIIQQAKADGLRQFHQTWYRPESMALIAVGDFDLGWMEQQISSFFQNMPSTMPQHASPLLVIPFLGKRDTLIYPELFLPFSILELKLNTPAALDHSPKPYMRALAIEHFIEMLIELELQKKSISKTPGTNINFRSATDWGQMRYFTLNANGDPQSMPTIFQSVLPTIIDLAKGNLSDARFANVQKRLINEAKQYKVFDQSVQNATSDHANLLNEAFLNELPYGVLIKRWDVLVELYTKIRKEDLFELTQHWLNPTNQMLLLAHPTHATATATASRYWQLLDSLTLNHQALPDEATLRPWFDTPLPSKVAIACQKDHAYTIREIHYTNGVKVALKSLPGEARIHFQGESYGGTDFVPQDKKIISNVWRTAVQASGAGSFSAEEIAQRKADFDLEEDIQLISTMEMIRASSPPENFKDLMALIHLRLSQPNFSENELNRAVQERILQEKNHQFFTANILNDFHNKRVSPPHSTEQKYSSSEFQQIKLQDLEQLYRERFCNPADFDFIVMGDAPLDSLQAVVDAYLGNLPTRVSTKENYKMRPMKKPEIRPIIPVDTSLYVFNEAKAGVEIDYLTTWKSKRYTKHLGYFYDIDHLLEAVLRQKIREEQGAVYHVTVQSFNTDWRTGIRVIFECAPERAKELEAVADSCIQTFMDKNALANIVDNKKQRLLSTNTRHSEKAAHDQMFWGNQISQHFNHLDELDHTPEDQLDPPFIADYEPKIPSILKFQRFWKRLIVPTKKSRIFLLPKTNQVP